MCGNALSVTLSIALWYYGPEIASKSTSALARTLSAYGCDSVTPIDESMGKSLLVEACIEDPELVNGESVGLDQRCGRSQVAGSRSQR